MSFWEAPRLWERATCAVLASGPSMRREVAERVAGRCRVIAVNDQGVTLAPWADVLYAADHRWWGEHPEAADFAGLQVAGAVTEGEIEHFPPAVHVMGLSGEIGFDDRRAYLRSGGNSGYQAVHLAVHLGATRILLCGFDLHGERGEHWFGDHPWRPGHRSNYGRFVAAFEASAPEFARRGIELINTTPGSALTALRWVPLARALEERST